MRNERASQPGAARPKYRCLAEPTIDEASLLAACRSMARRPRRCADAAIDGLVHDRWLMRRLLAMLRPNRIRGTAISQLRLHLASRPKLHVYIGRPWSRSAAKHWTDRAWNGPFSATSVGFELIE